MHSQRKMRLFMNVHEQFAEDLALYALASLEGDERFALEKHLGGCVACRRELDVLQRRYVAGWPTLPEGMLGTKDIADVSTSPKLNKAYRQAEAGRTETPSVDDRSIGRY